MRRRQRRLRSMLRHERRSIAVALAEALHHSSGLPTMKVVERREREEEEVREERRATATDATSSGDLAGTPV